MINKVVACVFIVFVFALPAWCVVGNAEITVTDTGGKPLRGQTVSLISTTGTKVETKKTDDSGTVLIPAEEGNYVVEVGEGDNKTRTDISITGGQTATATVMVPGPIGTQFDIPPAGAFSYGDEDADDIPVTSSTDIITDTFNGIERTQTRQNDLRDLNKGFDFGLEWNHKSATFATGIKRVGDFFPFVKGSIGQVSAKFSSTNLAESRSNVFKGDGLSVAAGVGGLYVSNSPVIVGGGYLFSGYYDVNLKRQDPLQVVGGVVTRDDVEISYYRHQIRLFSGVKTPVVYPYAGIMAVFRRVDIEGVTEADFSQTFGFPVTRRIEFTNKLKEDTVEGLVGVGFRKDHFLAGVEGSWGKGYKNFLFQAAYGF